jgi:hypothetical protein
MMLGISNGESTTPLNRETAAMASYSPVSTYAACSWANADQMLAQIRRSRCHLCGASDKPVTACSYIYFALRPGMDMYGEELDHIVTAGRQMPAYTYYSL